MEGGEVDEDEAFFTKGSIVFPCGGSTALEVSFSFLFLFLIRLCLVCLKTQCVETVFSVKSISQKLNVL